jgi:hypothetical protein
MRSTDHRAMIRPSVQQPVALSERRKNGSNLVCLTGAVKQLVATRKFRKSRHSLAANQRVTCV